MGRAWVRAASSDGSVSTADFTINVRDVDEFDVGTVADANGAANEVTENALAGPNPRLFFEALRACGALRIVFPEVDKLFGVPQPVKWHPEVDAGLHTMLVIDEAERISEATEVRFAALVHDVGKGATDSRDLPSHPGHELRGREMIKAMAERLPLPRACRDLASLVAEFHTHCHRALELRSDTIVKVLERTDAFRRPDRFELFLRACEADARGRTGLENRDYRQADRFRSAFEAAASVDAAGIASNNDSDRIADEIRRARVRAVNEALALA